jgi:2,4-dienoyl-CoA reductase (NADPH2)
MAKSGVAVVVVEAATIDYPLGCGSEFVIRADTDENIEGLTGLSAIIKNEGAIACLQLNHVGRFLPPGSPAGPPVAPSAVAAMGQEPRALSIPEIKGIIQKYADAAVRAKKAGFDMVELHGGTGYLMSQFASHRTNIRDDEYGGSSEKRMRFGLEVLSKVKVAVGDMPVGLRFLADEWLPDGLKLEESIPYAKALAREGIAYISAMGGTYESFFLPDVMQRSREDGYMADLAGEIKKHVGIPVIAAGRISTGALAEKIINEDKADLIGLARVLWADSDWPEKVRNGREEEIIHCESNCGDACMQLIMMGRPAFCTRWPVEKQREWKGKVREE